MTKSLITALAIVVLLQGTAAAQNKQVVRKYPSAVLVMLNSETNRIKKFTPEQRAKDLEIVKKDAAEVVKVTKNDFRDHFHNMPVFYFMDTNIARIKKHDFAGVVTADDGSPAGNIPDNYIIAYYGYPDFHSDPDALFRKGLVIADDTMKQLTNGAIAWRYFAYGRNKKYSYESRRFDIMYVPVAKRLSKLLLKAKRS